MTEPTLYTRAWVQERARRALMALVESDVDTVREVLDGLADYPLPASASIDADVTLIENDLTYNFDDEHKPATFAALKRVAALARENGDAVDSVVVVYRHPDSETAISQYGTAAREIVLDFGSSFNGRPDDEETAIDWLEGVGYQVSGLPADHPARVEVEAEAIDCVEGADLGFDEAACRRHIAEGERQALARVQA